MELGLNGRNNFNHNAITSLNISIDTIIPILYSILLTTIFQPVSSHFIGNGWTEPHSVLTRTVTSQLHLESQSSTPSSSLGRSGWILEKSEKVDKPVSYSIPIPSHNGDGKIVEIVTTSDRVDPVFFIPEDDNENDTHEDQKGVTDGDHAKKSHNKNDHSSEPNRRNSVSSQDKGSSNDQDASTMVKSSYNHHVVKKSRSMRSLPPIRTLRPNAPPGSFFNNIRHPDGSMTYVEEPTGQRKHVPNWSVEPANRAPPIHQQPQPQHQPQTQTQHQPQTQMQVIPHPGQGQPIPWSSAPVPPHTHTHQAYGPQSVRQSNFNPYNITGTNSIASWNTTTPFSSQGHRQFQQGYSHRFNPNGMPGGPFGRPPGHGHGPPYPPPPPHHHPSEPYRPGFETHARNDQSRPRPQGVPQAQTQWTHPHYQIQTPAKQSGPRGKEDNPHPEFQFRKPYPIQDGRGERGAFFPYSASQGRVPSAAPAGYFGGGVVERRIPQLSATPTRPPFGEQNGDVLWPPGQDFQIWKPIPNGTSPSSNPEATEAHFLPVYRGEMRFHPERQHVLNEESTRLGMPTGNESPEYLQSRRNRTVLLGNLRHVQQVLRNQKAKEDALKKGIVAASSNSTATATAAEVPWLGPRHREDGNFEPDQSTIGQSPKEQGEQGHEPPREPGNKSLSNAGNAGGTDADAALSSNRRGRVRRESHDVSFLRDGNSYATLEDLLAMDLEPFPVDM